MPRKGKAMAETEQRGCQPGEDEGGDEGKGGEDWGQCWADTDPDTFRGQDVAEYG